MVAYCGPGRSPFRAGSDHHSETVPGKPITVPIKPIRSERVQTVRLQPGNIQARPRDTGRNADVKGREVNLLRPGRLAQPSKAGPSLHVWLRRSMLIPMKVDSDSDLIPVTRSDGMPVTFGA